MQSNMFDGYPFALFLTLLICIQCSGNYFGGGDVSRDVSYAPGAKVDLLRVVFQESYRIYQAQ